MQVAINTNLKIDDEPSFVKRILVVGHALIEDNLDIICIKQMVNYHTARTKGGKLNTVDWDIFTSKIFRL